MRNEKKAAPKRDENLKTQKQQAYKRIEVELPQKKVSEKELAMEAKAQAKADKKTAKTNKKAAKNSKHAEQVLHFHFFRFLIHLLMFIVTTVILAVLTSALLFAGSSFTIGSTTIEIPASLSATASFVIGCVVMLTFAIWMAEFQLGFRRFFRIGKQERINKALAKKAKKESKKKA